MQSKSYQVFKVTLKYDDNGAPQNDVQVVQLPSEAYLSDQMVWKMLERKHASDKKTDKRVEPPLLKAVFCQVTRAEKITHLTARIAALQTTDFKDNANNENEFLLIESPLSEDNLKTSLTSSINTVESYSKSTLSYNNIFVHRSTWMGVVMVFSAILLTIGLVASLAIFEIVGPVLTVFLALALMFSLARATTDFFTTIFSGSFIDSFNRIIDWIKNNSTQVIIASAGVTLSLIGMGLLIGLAPIMGTALTLACGCSLIGYVLVLAVFGPTTIADAINRYLDVRQAEGELAYFEDVKKWDVGVTENLISMQGGNNKIVNAVFLKEVDKGKEQEKLVEKDSNSGNLKLAKE